MLLDSGEVAGSCRGQLFFKGFVLGFQVDDALSDAVARSLQSLRLALILRCCLIGLRWGGQEHGFGFGRLEGESGDLGRQRRSLIAIDQIARLADLLQGRVGVMVEAKGCVQMREDGLFAIGGSMLVFSGRDGWRGRCGGADC